MKSALSSFISKLGSVISLIFDYMDDNKYLAVL